MAIRVGILGCGAMEDIHQANFSGLAGRAEVTACVDPDIERAQRSAAVLGGRPARDVTEVLDDVDAVLGVLPHHLHYPVGLACRSSSAHDAD